MNIIYKYLFYFLCLAPAMSVAAEIYYDESMEKSLLPYFNFNGLIEEGDYIKLKNLMIKYYPRDYYKLPIIIIHSEGGSVVEALKISELVRSAKARVWVDKYCASACFYIFASARSRGADGNAVFALHRPYLRKTEMSKLSSSEADEKYKQLEIAVKKKLIKFRVPMQMIDHMMNHSSKESWEISGKDMVSSLGEYDASYEEWLIAKCGDLDPSEKKDLSRMKYDCSKIPNEERYMSVGYCKYLRDKSNKVSGCRNNEIFKLQRDYLLSLKNNN